MKYVFWGLMFLGGYFALISMVGCLAQYAATRWPTAEGKVIRKEIVDESGFYSVRVEYEYQVDGKRFTNDDVYLNTNITGVGSLSTDLGSEDRSEAEVMGRPYSVGSMHRVHYHADDPGRAALVIDPTTMLVMVAMGMVFFLFGLIPLKYPGLFQTARERVSDDDLARFDRVPIVLGEVDLREMAREPDESGGTAWKQTSSLLDDSKYRVKTWKPGERIEYWWKTGSVLRSKAYVVLFDWERRILVCGPADSPECVPFDQIDEIRIHGSHLIRQSGGGKSGGKTSYESWDVWIDAIVEDRRFRLGSQTHRREPDQAFVAALSPAAPLAITLEKPIRWIGFEHHPEYRPPRKLPPLEAFIETIDDESQWAVSVNEKLKSPIDIASVVGESREDDDESNERQAGPAKRPAGTRVSIDASTDCLAIKIPIRMRISDGSPIGISIAIGFFASLITPAAWDDENWGPLIFVGCLWGVSVIGVVMVIKQLFRRGRIEVTASRLSVIEKGMWFSRRFEGPIDGVLTVCVTPSGEERDGLPIEQLSVIETDGDSHSFFRFCDSRELYWICDSVVAFAGLAKAPVVNQSDPQKAVVEIARSVIDKSHHEMSEAIDEMVDQRDRATSAKEDFDEAAAKVPELERLATRFETIDPAVVAEKRRELTRSKIDVIVAEFGSFDFDEWDPGRLIRLENVTLDDSAKRIPAIASGLGWGIVFFFVAPFAIPILGSIIVIPVALLGTRRLHYTIADVMGLDSGIFVWIAGLTVLSIVWTYLKLDAAFAPREVELDWSKKRLTLRDRFGEQVYSFREIRRILVRQVSRPDKKHGAKIYRMELKLAGRTINLIEDDEATEVAGLSQHSISVEDRVTALAIDLAGALEIPLEQADAIIDRNDVSGFPRKPKLKDLFLVWKRCGRKARATGVAIGLGMSMAWIAWFIKCYLDNAAY